MIPSFNTNNTTPVNIISNTAATQDNQASTNTSLTTTNWNSSFTVNSAPRPRNMVSSVFSKIAIGIGILCRSIASTAAETIESSTPTATSVRNIATTADTALVESSSSITGLEVILIALIAIGIGGSTILFFIRILGIFPSQQGTRVPQQPRITEAEQRKREADNLIINNFCKLEYKNLPLVEIDIKDIQDKNCPICFSHVDKNVSLTTLSSVGSNESMATEDKWVLYKEQFYHLNELQEAVAINRKVPHTQEIPVLSELKAVKILQGLNDIPNTSVESTIKKPESFIVDIPENQDTNQFSENDNDEESTAFLETAL
jgi:hypothetical protein